jgi:hypothetical protein
VGLRCCLVRWCVVRSCTRRCATTARSAARVTRGAAGGRAASSSPRGAREGPCVWAGASLPVEVDVRADAGREVAVTWPSRRRRAGTCTRATAGRMQESGAEGAPLPKHGVQSPGRRLLNFDSIAAGRLAAPCVRAASSATRASGAGARRAGRRALSAPTSPVRSSPIRSYRGKRGPRGYHLACKLAWLITTPLVRALCAPPGLTVARRAASRTVRRRTMPGRRRP